MIRLDGLKLPIDRSESELPALIAARIGCDRGEIIAWRILRKSLDARKKNDLHYVYTVEVDAGEKGKDCFPDSPRRAERMSDLDLPQKKGRVAVVGAGPAGLFAALTLLAAGVTPVILERGSDVDRRTCIVEKMRLSGVLDPSCNVQFGEGGAGTFSDGKLNTGISNPLISVVLGELVAHGAPAEILYAAKPHVGTDYLRKVVKQIRNDLLARGAEIYFDTCVTGLKVQNGKLAGLRACGKTDGIDCLHAIFAVGHSARDTFEMLSASGVAMQPKPFAVGVRVEHPQAWLNRAQYGKNGTGLPPADYKLAAHTDSRSVYTFCMCPGGEVVAAASEEGGVVTNGMSYYARDGLNANSALLVNVTPADYPAGVLGGVEFQRNLERKAFLSGGGGYCAPACRMGDFLRGKGTATFGSVKPSYHPGVTGADLREVLPDAITCALQEGIRLFDRKLRGFLCDDAVLTAVESRSSSPVRILRDERRMSVLEGLYPCGEGAGYAGGITSAAVDGIRTALAVLDQL